MNRKKKENNITTKNKKTGKAANTKLSRSDRDRIVNNGSAKEVAKYKDRLSTRELETAVNRLQQEKIKRIDLEKKLDSINTPERKRAITLEKIDKYASSLEKASNSIEKAAKFYNTAAKVHNAMSPATDQWPIYGEKKTAKFKPSAYADALAKTGTMDDVMKNRKRLNDTEFNNAVKRKKHEEELKEMIRKQREYDDPIKKESDANQLVSDYYKNRLNAETNFDEWDAYDNMTSDQRDEYRRKKKSK